MNHKYRILILFAHPALRKSRVNRVLKAEIIDLDGVEFHDLYRSYPDFDINVPLEQQRLESHDIIIFQHPFFWYSTPSIVKEYLDLVLEHNWAYGSQGNALKGKWAMHAITTGGRASSYGPAGLNRFTMREFLRPLEQTAVLCGMHFLPPFLVHGSHLMEADTINAHAATYRQLVIAMRDGRLDLASVKEDPSINSWIERRLRDSDQGEKDAG